MSCPVCSDQEHELGWSVFTPTDPDSDIAIHVIPHNDTAKHLLDADGACWCSPMLDEEADDLLFVHNSHDQREKFHHGLRKPN